MFNKFHTAFFFAVVFYSASSLAAPAYVLTDLGTLGGMNSLARALNESGQVVGRSEVLDYSSPVEVGTAYHAFLYENGVMRDIHFPDGQYSDAWGINNRGLAVGYFFDYGDYSGSFLYDGGQIAEILDFTYYGTAYDINDSGQIAGEYIGEPALYSEGNMRRLSLDQGQTDGQANSLNNSGQVVGRGTTSLDDHGHFAFHAFLSDGDSMTDLGTLGGYRSDATDINNEGIVVGGAETGDYAYLGIPITHAFLYDNGNMVDLGVLSGRRSSYALAINDNGVIVGESDGRAFVYRNGNMVDLNDLVDPMSGFSINAAVDINNSGQIAANGCNADGCHALLLTPVPEPEAYAMIIVGLILVTMYSKSRLLT